MSCWLSIGALYVGGRNSNRPAAAARTVAAVAQAEARAAARAAVTAGVQLPPPSTTAILFNDSNMTGSPPRHRSSGSSGHIDSSISHSNNSNISNVDNLNNSSDITNVSPTPMDTPQQASAPAIPYSSDPSHQRQQQHQSSHAQQQSQSQVQHQQRHSHSHDVEHASVEQAQRDRIVAMGIPSEELTPDGRLIDREPYNRRHQRIRYNRDAPPTSVGARSSHDSTTSHSQTEQREVPSLSSASNAPPPVSSSSSSSSGGGSGRLMGTSSATVSRRRAAAVEASRPRRERRAGKWHPTKGWIGGDGIGSSGTSGLPLGTDDMPGVMTSGDQTGDDNITGGDGGTGSMDDEGEDLSTDVTTGGGPSDTTVTGTDLDVTSTTGRPRKVAPRPRATGAPRSVAAAIAQQNITDDPSSPSSSTIITASEQQAARRKSIRGRRRRQHSGAAAAAIAARRRRSGKSTTDEDNDSDSKRSTTMDDDEDWQAGEALTKEWDEQQQQEQQKPSRPRRQHRRRQIGYNHGGSSPLYMDDDHRGVVTVGDDEEEVHNDDDPDEDFNPAIHGDWAPARKFDPRDVPPRHKQTTMKSEVINDEPTPSFLSTASPAAIAGKHATSSSSSSSDALSLLALAAWQGADRVTPAATSAKIEKDDKRSSLPSTLPSSTAAPVVSGTSPSLASSLAPSNVSPSLSASSPSSTTSSIIFQLPSSSHIPPTSSYQHHQLLHHHQQHQQQPSQHLSPPFGPLLVGGGMIGHHYVPLSSLPLSLHPSSLLVPPVGTGAPMMLPMSSMVAAAPTAVMHGAMVAPPFSPTTGVHLLPSSNVTNSPGRHPIVPVAHRSPQSSKLEPPLSSSSMPLGGLSFSFGSSNFGGVRPTHRVMPSMTLDMSAPAVPLPTMTMALTTPSSLDPNKPTTITLPPAS
jgi:hypothetical protein